MDIRKELSRIYADFAKKISEFQSNFIWVVHYLDKEDIKTAKIIKIESPESVNKPITELISLSFPDIKEPGIVNQYIIFSRDKKIRLINHHLDIDKFDLVLGVEYDYEVGEKEPVSMTDWFFFSKPIQWGLLQKNIMEAEKQVFVEFFKKLYGIE